MKITIQYSKDEVISLVMEDAKLRGYRCVGWEFLGHAATPANETVINLVVKPNDNQR